tara:strand:- start:5917 stop:6603 length:687 start_codon:yes stop_codon:yes gene_type:complete
LKNKKIIALIIAKKNSKRLSKKNFRKIKNISITERTIKIAKTCKYLDKIMLSSDSKELIQIANKHKISAPFIRPAYLCKSKVKPWPVIKHSINYLSQLKEKYDFMLLLQPTSALRKKKHIDKAIQIMKKNKYKKNVYSMVTKDNCKKIKFAKIYAEVGNKFSQSINILNQKQIKTKAVVNGNIYLFNIKKAILNRSHFLNNSIGFLMNKKDSIDIDTLQDLKEARKYI